MKIVQVLNTFTKGDAIGNYALAIRELLRTAGYDSEVFTESIYEDKDNTGVKHIISLPDLQEDDILIFHLSISVRLFVDLGDACCKKIVIYHNITPYEYFADYSNFSFTLSRDAMIDVKCLSQTFDYGIAVSTYNKEGLIEFGYKCPIDVLPIIVPFDDYKQEPGKAVVDKYNDGRTNIIFVGRVVPNKKQEDIISAFSAYKKYYDSEARLFIVGSSLNMEAYKSRLDSFIELNSIDDVIFTGKIPFDELLAYYHIADIFLCMSEHEGFCVPLIEAMFFDVPVIAYASAAVPETLGGSGILLNEKDPLQTAGIINKLVSDKSLRSAVINDQQKRLEDYSYDTLSRQFIKLIEDFNREYKGRQV